MANTNAPFGIKPYKMAGEPKTQEYTIASGLAETFGRGHPVQMTGTGRNIAVAEAGNVDNLGVFWGVRYVDSSGNQVFSSKWVSGTAGTDIVALVVPFDDPGQEFLIQCDTLAEGDVGTTMDWNAGTTDTVYGMSRAYLTVTGSSTSGGNLKIAGLAPLPNNAYGAYAKAIVTVQESRFWGAGVGV